MYHIKIIAVGGLNEPFWRAAQSEYLKRLSASAKLTITEIAEGRTATADTALTFESRSLLAVLPERTRIIALCVEGMRLDSIAFARAVETAGMRSDGRLCFIVGGSNGLHDDVKRRADDRISLSDMTLPHALARVFLLEQLYRAFEILRGGKYHK